jgi:hypothetical protein
MSETTVIRTIARLSLGCALLLPSACKDDDATGEPMPASTRNHLLWKRAHALEQDLARALALPPAEVCTELGQYSCAEQVHLTSLGGHDPFRQGLYAPLDKPLVTTPLVSERMALAACTRRVTEDRTGDAEVFTDLDLDGDAPAVDSDAFTGTITTLYRRLLQRDPTDAELELLGELAVDDDGAPVAAADFAQLACFTIATTTEFLFL